MTAESRSPDFSIGLQVAWRLAAGEAVQTGHELIQPEHLFAGLCRTVSAARPDARSSKLTAEQAAMLEAEGRAIETLIDAFHIDAQAYQRELRDRTRNAMIAHGAGATVSRSPESKAVFETAGQLASGHGHITTLHLLGALLKDPSGPVATELQRMGVDVMGLREATLAALPATRASRASDQWLMRFGTDLTARAREGRIHECIGRRDEMLQLLRTLSRETKNNPLLVGEPGVGKTAIVEGLAWRIAQNKDRVLSNRRVIQIEPATVVAGAKQRGDLEERWQGILREASNSQDVILFIDEIHTLVGAGGSGAREVANIMKPALARGELRCIGATTGAEYRTHIETDPALDRRFQQIAVAEPSQGETLEILRRGYVTRLEENYQVTIEPSALEAAVTLATRYLPSRRLPDKAVDLLDEACARVAVPALSLAPGMEPAGAVVTAAVIAEVLAEWTGLPIGALTDEERERLTGMALELKRRVIGQDAACDAIAVAVRRARAGLKAAGRPIGAFLCVGPTGVGKTELARATAAFLFGSDTAMVRLDMSEYMEKHTVARLIGAPPGYIGHDEEGLLTGALRKTPFCVVLLDEVEKAHPDVLNLFLQLFDEGRLTDSKGRTADATNALFIVTSNVGHHHFSGPLPLDEASRAACEAAVMGDVRKSFRPELLNRFDEVVVFHPLRPQDIANIASIMLGQLRKQLSQQQIGLTVTDAALEWLCAEGYDPMNGARPLRRTLAQHLESPVADRIMKRDLQPGKSLRIDVTDGRLTLDTIEAYAPPEAL